MHSLTNQQLNLILRQLDHAIQLHDQWYKDLLRVLIPRLKPNVEDLMPNSHHRCHFGQWCYSNEARFLVRNPAFISLLLEHEKMHSEAQNLLQLLADEQPIPLRKWERFDNYLEKTQFSFQALRQEYADISQHRDPLTEAQTRENMLLELREQDALVKRERQSCALVMFDLDHFKRINDKYGHIAGDAVLVSIVRCVKSLLRQYDQVYRYGGEEFLICMPSTTVDEAIKVVERMRSAVEKLQIQFDNSQVRVNVTVSFGIACLMQDRSVEESIDYADKAMYEAKVSGRNRVEIKV
jgi:diguanylate cyclase (GGDEF)-like protein